jgi:voltage-gated potassium channel
VPTLGHAAIAGLLATVATSLESQGVDVSYAAVKREVRSAIARDPFDATVVTVLGGAFLFYVAEKGQNPKVETYWDALLFISTCLSVGYADVFARTPAGKAIASAVMTVGPAMSGAMLDPAAEPSSTRAPDGSAQLLEVQRAIVDKLDAILTELRASAG